MELKLEKLLVIARKFILHMLDNKIFAFVGEMGVGKTTFIKGICEVLMVKDTVNSPTFSIVNEYYSEILNNKIYHFDFYRINNIEELNSIGIEDYFESGAICFIEWADKVRSILPKETVFINIEERMDGFKDISWSFK